MLRELYALRGFSPEQELWFTALYLAYYHLPSAVAAFDLHPTLRGLDVDALVAKRLPTGIERRGLRTDACLRAHLWSYQETFSGMNAVQQRLWLTVREEQHSLPYDAFWERAQRIAYNGRWSAFKWGELLHDVHGWSELDAPDMRLKFCSGPREGLAWLYGLRTPSVQKLELCAFDLKARLALRGRLLSWARLETVLCNFNSLRKGRYYVGHDIDEMIERMTDSLDAGRMNQQQWHDLVHARTRALPAKYLYERTPLRLGGEQIDHERKSIYARSGVVVLR